MSKTGKVDNMNSNVNTKATAIINTKVITGKIRMAYANLFTARPMSPGQEPKYSLCVLIPKEDASTISKINLAIDAAQISGVAVLGDISVGDFKTPLRDGDAERPDQLEYAGHYFLNAASRQKPGVVDKRLNEVLDASVVYSGCYGRVSLNFYAFNQGGNKGIGCGLQNVQKLSEGELLSTRATAEEDFDVVANEEDVLA